MKILKIKDHEIRAIERNGQPGYELSITVMKNGIFKSGGLLKNKATDKEIKNCAKELIELSNSFESFGT